MLKHLTMYFILCAMYFTVLLLLACYGFHRSYLVFTCMQHRKELDKLKTAVSPLTLNELKDIHKCPMLTVQLPLYNEATVATRLLEYIARLEYPLERLEIQVLDDSTDETRFLVSEQLKEMRKQGFNTIYLHRTNRIGYKAGALEAGLHIAKGELIAIFDADFLPDPSFCRVLIPHFQDPKVGMVQARWGHLNRDFSLLTRVEALMLDGHHLVENRARVGANWLFNFSGTGGIWRKEAIENSGGWQHDTLTEDLDLSYRAQLAGWKFIYRADIVTPAELPEELSTFRAQQYRWAKGTVQTARKLLKRVMNSDLTRSQKVEAFFHLTPHFAYPLMMILSLLLLPALILMPATNVTMMLLIDLPLCVGTTGSLMGFYMLAQTAQGRSASDAVRLLPALLAIGAGLAPHLSQGVLKGFQAQAGEFVRTPKKGGRSSRYQSRTEFPFLEAFLCLFSVGSTFASLETKHWFATPFALLFACGYGYVTCSIVGEQMSRRSSYLPQNPMLHPTASSQVPLANSLQTANPTGSSQKLAI
ncbi:glycosyltransferase [Pajaroellobacter abortibovis]|uniref:Glycosyltransferase n=1 Tax=Pajaroellobacter abortibovis TaxID=1882918 RepID=A0A1L6MWC1_9BACT|nr:glycosyltransferase [Pajaroellobacter abortibovis]APR99816.1 glycosyltransferase [Pajaroellobacter abortibovis]